MQQGLKAFLILAGGGLLFGLLKGVFGELQGDVGYIVRIGIIAACISAAFIYLRKGN